VRERACIRDVVDRDDLDIRVRLLRGAEHVAADTAEAVDADPYGHVSVLPIALRYEKAAG
jgi:hypothetical protein